MQTQPSDKQGRAKHGHVTQLVVENEVEIHQGTIIHWRYEFSFKSVDEFLMQRIC